MKKELSDRYLRSLVPPSEGRLEISDTRRPGLRFRLSSHGKAVWMYEKRIKGGKKRKHTLGAWPEPVSLSDAREQALTPEAVQLRQMGLFEEIATVLTQTRGAGAQRALRTINRAIAGQPIKDAEAAHLGRVVAATGGLLVHRQSQQRLMQ